MNLRKKIITIIGFTFFFLILLLFIISKSILERNFLKLENDYTAKNVTQALSALDKDVDNLDTSLVDWSSWDDTYTFIDDKNTDYIKSNIVEDVLDQMNINTLIFINRNKEIVLSKNTDFEKQKVAEITSDLEATILSNDFYNKAIDNGLKGILITSKGPMLIAARPILHSDNSGVPKGLLIMGRYLNKKEITELTNTTGLTLDFQMLQDNNMPQDIGKAYDQLEQGTDIYMKEIDSNHIAGYSLIKDINSKPVIIVKVNALRNIYKQGISTIKFFTIFLCGIAIIIAIAIILLLEKLVLSPLRILTKSVSNISESHDLSIRIPVYGKDELGILASHTNEMLSELEISNDKLLDSEANYKKLFEDMKKTEIALIEAKDAAETANITKSTFLATMSHEIRTPMNAIIGMTELLAETQLDGKQKDLVNSVSAAGNLLLSIINDVLDFSKIEAGKLVLNRMKFDITSVVEGVAEMLTVKAHEKKLTLMTSIHPGIPIVLGDEYRLKQILLNLLGNAIKFTDKGEIVVTAYSDSQNEREIKVIFEVSDTGIGIDKEQSGKLFQPFVQADGSNTRKYGGTGLGLSISKKIVELMNGEIFLESNVGIGSTFKFTAIFECSNCMDEQKLRSLNDIKVLLLSYSEVSCNIITNYLKAWGVSSCQVYYDNNENYENLFNSNMQKDYDLILLDTGSYHKDRDYEYLKRTNKPAILIIPYDLHGEGLAAINSGFAAVLTKPLKQSGLFDCIITVINHYIKYQEPVKQIPESNHESLHILDENQGNLKVLLAEDNTINQKLALMQFEKLGLDVEIAVDGREALNKVAANQYSVIFMDCQMPEMDGYEATKAIRKLEATQGYHIPIIAMTANAMEDDREKCLYVGMDDYLPKPIRLKNLSNMLNKWNIKHASIE